MISIDMKNTYYIPFHEESRQLLSFTLNNKVFQFRALRFGLSMSSQGFYKGSYTIYKLFSWQKSESYCTWAIG